VRLASSRTRKGGFTLLQGPPGTGKTKTVVALLNAIHLNRYLKVFFFLRSARPDQRLVPNTPSLPCWYHVQHYESLKDRAIESMRVKLDRRLGVTLTPDPTQQSEVSRIIFTSTEPKSTHFVVYRIPNYR
jgi:energy-coupling factor transporter ATP-binding protein EcfA2